MNVNLFAVRAPALHSLKNIGGFSPMPLFWMNNLSGAKNTSQSSIPAKKRAEQLFSPPNQERKDYNTSPPATRLNGHAATETHSSELKATKIKSFMSKIKNIFNHYLPNKREVRGEPNKAPQSNIDKETENNIITNLLLKEHDTKLSMENTPPPHKNSLNIKSQQENEAFRKYKWAGADKFFEDHYGTPDDATFIKTKPDFTINKNENYRRYSLQSLKKKITNANSFFRKLSLQEPKKPQDYHLKTQEGKTQRNLTPQEFNKIKQKLLDNLNSKISTNNLTTSIANWSSLTDNEKIKSYEALVELRILLSANLIEKKLKLSKDEYEKLLEKIELHPYKLAAGIFNLPPNKDIIKWNEEIKKQTNSLIKVTDINIQPNEEMNAFLADKIASKMVSELAKTLPNDFKEEYDEHTMKWNMAVALY